MRCCDSDQEKAVLSRTHNFVAGARCFLIFCHDL